MVDPEQFKRLLAGYLQGNLAEGEETLFFQALATGNHRDTLSQDIISRLQAPAASHSIQSQLHPETAQRIIDHILSATAMEAPVRTLAQPRQWLRWTAVAAALLLAVCMGVLFHNTRSRQYTIPLLTGEKDLTQQTNPGSSTLSIHLEDGSIVDLQPGSRLFYPTHFSGDKREVRLEGNAFFTIAPNANKPFYAFSKDLVTQVLGTSFNIDCNETKKEIKIAVRTGKVAVFRRSAGNDNTMLPSADGQPAITLLPNQQVSGAEGEGPLTPGLVDSPAVLNDTRPLIFKATPVSEIFTRLQEKYGIDIIMENPSLGKSLFTGDLSRQSFYTALKLVCFSLNHAYYIRGTTIYIAQ